MRIGHVASNIWASVHLDMAKALRRAGHEVCVYTEDARAPSARTFTRVTENGVELWVVHPERRNPFLWLPDRLGKALLGSLLGRRFFTTLFALDRYVSQSRCDNYLVEGDSLGLAMALLGRMRRIPWVMSVHDHEYLGVAFGYAGEPSSERRESLKRWVLRQADGIRANSHVTRDALARSGIDERAIRVVPLHWTPRMIMPGELEDFRTAARPEVTTRYGLRADCDLILASCRLTPFKGLELAVQALARVLKTRPQARLLICGADRRVPGVGSYRAILERTANEAGVSAAIVFTGDVPTDGMKTCYAAADVHVAPSHVDTFNYSALEAALAGTHTIMTETVGSGPWLAACGAATIVRGRDPQTFGEAVASTLAARPDAGSRRAIAECVREVLSADALAPELVSTLRACAAAH